MMSFASFVKAPIIKKQLNPRFWDNNLVRSSVREILLVRERDFVSKLGLAPSSIEDIRLVGGNASSMWHDSSDPDVTIKLNRGMNLSKEDVRRIRISASNLNYRLSATLDGVDLNFYLMFSPLG